jgi:hypothetical protein
MDVNGIGIPLTPTPRIDHWLDETRDQRHRLRQDKRINPTWGSTDNDSWWVDFYNVRRYEELHNTEGLIGPLTLWNKDGRAHF